MIGKCIFAVGAGPVKNMVASRLVFVNKNLKDIVIGIPPSCPRIRIIYITIYENIVIGFGQEID